MNTPQNFFKDNPDYKVPKPKGNYLKIGTDENVKLRILSYAITGYEYFNKEGKPVRSQKMFEGIPEDIGTREGKMNPIKHFWAMVIWNYNEERIQIWEITQSTIQNNLYAYAMDDDFGDIRSYDLKVECTGKKLETKYTVKALPPRELDNTIAETLKNTPVRLEALFDGSNPFSQSDIVPEPENGEIEESSEPTDEDWDNLIQSEEH